MDPWAALLLASVFEVGFTTCLKLEQRNKNWALGFLACAVVRFGEGKPARCATAIPS